MQNSYSSILVIKIGAIGDLIMSMPLIPALKKKYPSAHLTWVTGSRCAPLISATGLVDRLIEVSEENLFKGGLSSRLREFVKIWRALLFTRYDLVLLLHPDPRYRLLTLFTRSKESRSLGQRLKRFHPVPGRYHVFEYLSLLEEKEGPLEMEYTFPHLTVKLNKESEVDLESLKGTLMIALFPGGAKNILADDPLRRWPIGHYAKLIQLFNQHSITPLVVGSSEDFWILSHFATLSFKNYLGQLGLLEVVALLKEVNLLITHDSGPLHLGKLAACPTIALFGPTQPSEKVGNLENIDLVWGGGHLGCRPCYNGKSYAKCSYQACLASITPEEVLKRVLNFNKRKDAASRS